MSITKKDGGYQRWTHEVCRIWCSSSTQVDTGLISEESEFGNVDMDKSVNSVLEEPIQDLVCSLCGMGKIHNEGKVNEEVLQIPESPPCEQTSPSAIGLIKCAATGCGIYFHPMCALLYTKLSQEYCNSVAKLDSKDSFQSKGDCDSYTLDFVQISKKQDRVVADMEERNDTDDRQTYILPVGFCALHNQIRGTDMYGMPSTDSGEFEKISRLMKIPYQLD
jgi:hypothetical protein